LSWGVPDSWEDASREDLLAAVREVLAVNAAQAQRIVVLEARVAQLERQLSRNSGNSSMPPSTDDLPGRKTPAPRSSGKGGSRGKRKGAPGAGLEWSADPTQTVPHYPSGVCGCGQDLGEAADEGIARSHQVHDAPLVHRDDHPA
jgi:transposase